MTERVDKDQAIGRISLRDRPLGMVENDIDLAIRPVSRC